MSDSPDRLFDRPARGEFIIVDAGDGGQPGTSQSAASQASPRQEEQQHRQRPRLVLSTTNIAICSSVALLKAFRTPVPGLQQLKESQATLPGWLFKDMEKRALSRHYGSQVLRDTAVLLFTTKLADGSLFQLLRGGTDDVFNRVLGSATAGALITSVLFASPRVSQVVGYSAFSAVFSLAADAAEQRIGRHMLERQWQLQRELMPEEKGGALAAGAKYERDKFVKLLQMKRQKEQQQQQQSATAPAAESASLDGGTHAARVTSSQQSFGLE